MTTPKVTDFPRRAAPDPDAPEAEKEPIERRTRFYVEAAAEFLAEEDPPEVFVVNELVPAQTLVLLHGEPRTRKSWAALELAIAAATGTPAFGLARFAVPAPVPVLYSSQEDGRRPVRARVRRFLRGRDLTTPPAGLHFSVHGGINLDNEAWQEALLHDTARLGIRLLVLDPIRRYSPNVDKGPAEVRTVTAFLRRLAVQSECSVVIVHHDVKPGREREDTRRRSHKASGGDWFAASECPIAAEPAGRNRTLLVPEDFKFGEDPAAFSFSIEEDEAKTYARLTAEAVESRDVAVLGLHERILEHLRHNPGSAGNAIAKGIHAGKGGVLEALERLSAAGKVDSVQEKRKTSWFIREEA